MHSCQCHMPGPNGTLYEHHLEVLPRSQVHCTHQEQQADLAVSSWRRTMLELGRVLLGQTVQQAEKIL